MKAFIVFSMALAIAASTAVDESKKEKRGLWDLGSDHGSFDQESFKFPEHDFDHHHHHIEHKEPEVKYITVEKKVPVYVEKKVPVHVDRPVPYPVIQKEYVEVPKPYAVHVEKEVPVVIHKPVYIEKAVPVTIKIKEHKKSFWG
uniref:Putative serine protease n=1 Tax=Culex tarsalis TaxID=7177 RepID=A0A1Q3FAR3_CULTA